MPANASLRSRDPAGFILPLIVAVALALRLWGIRFGLPNTWCSPDEGTLVGKAMAMGTGDLNPHFFNYPSLSFYVLAMVYGAYFAAGRVTGLFAGIADFQRQFFIDPSHWYLIGRVLVALLGAASTLLVYRIGKEMEGRRTGLIAAFFLSVAFLHVRDSHFLTTDVMATFLMLASCAWLVKYASRPRLGTLVLSALALGLATSTKYNVGLFGLWPLAAPWMVRDVTLTQRVRLAHSLLGVAGLTCAFIAASPFILIDFPTFWRDLSFERAHFSAGHGLDLHNDWTYHLRFSLLLGLGWPLLAVGVLGCGLLGLRRRPADILVLAGLVTYFAVASSGKTVFVRYMIPVVPLLTVAAASCVSRLPVKPPVVVLVALLLAAPTVVSSVRCDQLLARRDTRLDAADWIRSHVPGGSRIAMEGDLYGYPQVPRNRTCLEEQLQDYQAAGRNSRRLTRMLETEGYPPEPSYYVIELHKQGEPPLRIVRETYSLDMLRREGVAWVVIQDHPLVHSRGDALFREALAREARLEARFDPFRPDGLRPIYDPIDAFYSPYAGFAGVRQPGPGLSIYSLLPRDTLSGRARVPPEPGG